VQDGAAADRPRRAPGAVRRQYDAVATFEQKAHDLLSQANAHRELATNLAHHDT
jgi:hypothetical protein